MCYVEVVHRIFFFWEKNMDVHIVGRFLHDLTIYSFGLIQIWIYFKRK